MKSFHPRSAAAQYSVEDLVLLFTQNEVARATHSHGAGRLFRAICKQAGPNLSTLLYGSDMQNEFGWIPIHDETACRDARIKKHRIWYYLKKLIKCGLLETRIEENFHGYGDDVIFCRLPFLVVRIGR